MVSKIFLFLIGLIMNNPVIPFNPNNTKSSLPNVGLSVVMNGLYQNKVQNVNVDLSEFVRKSNEVSRELLGVNLGGEIKIPLTVFVAGEGTASAGEVERLDKPFASIQSAIDAIPGGAWWTIIIYPGNYTGDVVLPDNIKMYCYPGVSIYGDITLGDNTRLQFDCGSEVIGDLTDNGVSISCVICGCLVHEGEITLTGSGTVLTAHGDQMFQATITDATFNCYFSSLKPDASSFILGVSAAEINIYGLNAIFSGYALDLVRMQVGAGILNLYNCNVLAGGKGVVFEGATGSIWNSKVISQLPLSFDGTGVFEVIGNRFEGTNGAAIVAAIGSSTKIILRRNYITVANSAGANVSAIIPDTGNSLVLEENAIIAKGTGNSVIGSNPTTIKSLRGNGSNANVNANITETIDVVFVDANYE